MMETTSHLSQGWPIDLHQVDLRLGQRVVLQDVNLTLRPEQTPIVVLGENGAGKSQLLRLLHGLQPPSQGTIRWNGHAAPQAAGLYRKHLLLAAQQQPLRLGVTAYIDLCLRLRHVTKRRERLERIDQALTFAGLHPHAHRPARQLSIGQRQRLMLALARALDCQTLLLDEPTAHLDPIAANRVRAMIDDWRDTRHHLIVVSHDGEHTRRLARTVIFLDRGKLLAPLSATRFFDPKLDLPEAAARFRNSLGVDS